MSDYQQSTVSGTQWVRACRALIDNPLNGTPGIMFAEEQVTNLGAGQAPITHLVSNVSASFSDPTLPIALRDPATWELTGQTTTAGALYLAIASLYWQLALERDAVQAPAA